MLTQLLLTGLVGLVAGLSIGFVGVGGIIIVPALVQAGGVPIHVAIATAMSGFLVTGAVGTTVFARHGSLVARTALPLLLAAMPAALLGAFAAQWASPTALELTIALFTAASGLHILLRGRPADGARPAPLGRATGFGVGAFVGFVSALTGSGGPAVLLPVLLWLDVPVLVALGLGQAIQLPIAALATAGNVVGGAFAWALSLPLCIGLAVGAWVGAGLAHVLDQERLRRLVAIVLLGVGASMLAKAALRLA